MRQKPAIGHRMPVAGYRRIGDDPNAFERVVPTDHRGVTSVKG
jgi:hypothetical protein